MSIENKLHAVLLVAFVALVSAAVVSTVLDDAGRDAAVAGTRVDAMATRVASAHVAPHTAR